jgi:UDP-N-acetylmuramoyl-L-alanyl-D-glutamate--2,6-diaminopimelate ligase
MLDAGNRSCVIEATSYDSDLRRLDAVRFAALVFTNLGHDHLHYHGSLEAYFQAKRRLFLRGETPAAVNADDPFGRRLLEELGRRALGFGSSGDADVRPTDVRLSRDGARLRVGRLGLRTQLLGAHNVENVLAAVAAARLLDVDDAAVAEGVARLAGVPGRLERVDEGQPFDVFVDYAHKPEALAAVLRTARSLATGRVLCVFGCGGNTGPAKRSLMGRIAAELSDVSILTTDNPREDDPERIAAEVRAGGEPTRVEPDRRRAIAAAVELARPGDVLVVAGRGHEPVQTFAGGRTEPLDDREAVRAALRSAG